MHSRRAPRITSAAGLLRRRRDRVRLDADRRLRLIAHAASELEKARLRAVLDALPVGVFIADADGAINEINEQARKLWGAAPNVQTIGEYGEYRGWWPATSKQIEPHEWAMARALTNGEVSIGEVIDIERFDGTRATIVNNAAPIRDANGTIIGAVVAEIDITRQQQIERELKAAKELAENASRAKDEFLATVSHELRTPLTAILGWARMLRLPDMEPLRDEALDAIERNSRSLAQLIEDILDVSRIMAGKVRLTMRAVDVREVVAAAIETVQPMADARGVNLLAALPPSAVKINGDPDRLQQVVWNLLVNAVKFTPAGGTVDVSLRNRGGEACIVVTDTGRGIDAKFLPRMFDRFQQADTSAARDSGGLGLGLSIVRQLVELHGGSISARSEGIGCGATFEVVLPAPVLLRGETAPEPQRATHGLTCPPQLASLRVLLVDDQPDTRQVLSTLLNWCGVQVRTASSAGEALDIVRSEPELDMLISDIGMPGLDGYEMMRALREVSRMPAIAVTGYARDEDRQRALAAGFQSWVAKPVDPAELIAVMTSVAAARS